MDSGELSKRVRENIGASRLTFMWMMNFIPSHLILKPLICLVDLQLSIAKSNIKLHKFASNSRKVLDTFPQEDHAAVEGNVDFSREVVPTQRSLGLLWEVTSDTFNFSVRRTLSHSPIVVSSLR